MPLQKGRSRKTVGSNIRKMVHEYEDTGTIGASHPASTKKAVKQAVAIALTDTSAFCAITLTCAGAYALRGGRC